MKALKISFKFILALAIFIIAFSSCKQAELVSLESLLNDIVDREYLSYFPENNFKLKQFSSYDRASVSPGEEGWFANADYTRFIREETVEERKEYVLFDDEGSGAIVRWWMTFAGEGSYEGTLRIYIDNNPVPIVEDDVLKIISGQLLAGEPLSSSVSPECDYYRRGHNLYLPIPYSKRCKISYECDAIKESDGRVTPSIYYNINYREYSPKVKVESFNMEALEANRDLIKKINNLLIKEFAVSDEPLSANGKIAIGDTLSIEINSKASALDALRVSLKAENYMQALRSTVLSISFDGNTSIWVPLGDFFGTGFKLSESKTWYSGVNMDGSMNSSWIMPFRENATIRLINFGEQDVECKLEAGKRGYEWTDGSMYFGALWHEYNRIKSAGSIHVGGTDQHFDINYIDIEGKGVYMGDAITVYNTADAWWGEGDEKIYVDGELFPSSIGTGTEDYYGYAWCRPEVFSHPFIAQPSGSGNFHPGMSVNIRYRVLDCIPFDEKISSNIELWHWAPTVMNYALTSYFYVLPGYKVNIEPDIEFVKLKVPEKRSDLIEPLVDNEGIIEGENMEIISINGGLVERQFITTWDWSNKGQLWHRDGKPGDGFTMKFINPGSGRYKITGRLSKAKDYGISEYQINNVRAIKFNAYTPGEEVVDIEFGVFELKEGDNTLSVRILGKDKNAKPGYMSGIDRLVLKKMD